jgi:2-iminobutanoate/2-iminopropanoate deaminase
LNRFDLKAKVPALLNFVNLRETFENKEFLIMTKQVLNVPDAPKYPFSPAIRAGDYIFVSGQGGFQNPKTGEAIKGIEAQTRQCLQNMKQVLETAGASLDDVVKVTLFLGNVADYAKMNEVYQSYFQKGLPARSTAVAGLVIQNMLVEMECIAYCPQS